MKKLVFIFSGIILSLMLTAQPDNFSQVIYVVDDNGIQQQLDIFNNSKTPGAVLSISPGEMYTYFNFIKQPDGYYHIINNESGLYLETQSSPAYAGCKIIQNSPKGNDNQKWKILPGKWLNLYDDGLQCYFIMPKSNDELYITIKGASVVLSKFSTNQTVETQTLTFGDCFPETVYILTDRGYIPISDVIKGELVASWNIISDKIEYSPVDSVLVHNGKEYSLTRISFVNHNMLYAATNEYFNIELIDATENHPLLTPEGYKPVGNIVEGDKILYYSEYSQKLEECIVVRVQKNYSTVNEVYNIKLSNGMPYIVNHTIASPKCPYVSVIFEDEIYEVSEVLRNQLSPILDKYEYIDIPTENISGNFISIRIDERKDEISYIDNVYLMADDEILIPLTSETNSEIAIVDNKYLEMNKGEYLDLNFVLPEPVSQYSVLKLVVKGYYVLLY
ncbi:MAG TPA: RICIN domain-containing protein [Bacteroidales bacterium]|nr:RICIN domain-containing protein [Bacteroidales bacterium]